MIGQASRPLNGASVVVPIYNELENIPAFHLEISAALQAVGRAYELIYVDDGSTDGSTQRLAEIAKTDPHVSVIIFRRNYGQTAAMQAGIDAATMDAIVTIDGDMQNDPADIAAMLAKMDEGYDLVHGWRKDRHDALLTRKIPSRLANWLIARVTGFPIHDLGCTLKAMRTHLVREVVLYGNMHRFIPILLSQRGARCVEMVVNHRPRNAGRTKYGIGRTLTVLLDLVTVTFLLKYSAHPMRFFGRFGAYCILISALLFLLTVTMKLFASVDMTGNPFLLMSSVVFLTGIQLVGLGVIGELLIRILSEARRGPYYAVKETLRAGVPMSECPGKQ